MDAAQLQETVVRNLRVAIRRSGKSVSQIARESGVCDRTIYEYTGRKQAQTVPSTPTLVDLAIALGVSMDWLCGLEAGNDSLGRHHTD